MMKKTKRKNAMLQEYHKGGLCVHKMVMCQEGYCSECHIHMAALHLKYNGSPAARKQHKETDSRVLVSASK